MRGVRTRWQAAAAAFQAALSREVTAHALDGLGQTLWWSSDLTSALHLRDRAYAPFIDAGCHDDAARVAACSRGQLGVVMADGSEFRLRPGDAYRLDPGHDAWVEGDDMYMAVEFESLKDYAQPRAWG